MSTMHTTRTRTTSTKNNDNRVIDIEQLHLSAVLIKI